jgi:hypothetical protein
MLSKQGSEIKYVLDIVHTLHRGSAATCSIGSFVHANGTSIKSVNG